MPPRSLAVALLLMLIAGSGPIAAGPGHWDAQFADWGLDREADAVLDWQGRLVVGGGFTRGSNIALDCIGAWDGGSWSPLPGFYDGIPNSLRGYRDAVTHLIGLGESFVAVGTLILPTQDGGSASHVRIRSWDGSGWTSLGPDLEGDVRAVTVHEGELVLGGWFADPDGETRHTLLRWTAGAWTPMAGPASTIVHALQSHAGELVASGSRLDFSEPRIRTVHELVAWNGTTWTELPPPECPNIEVLTVFRGELLAGSRSCQQGGQLIARWDGTDWHDLGAGIVATPRTEDGEGSSSVLALGALGDELLVAGEFVEAGGLSSHRVAAWDGTTWRSLGTAVGGHPSSVTAWNSRPVVAGHVSLVGPDAGEHVLAFAGGSWGPLRRSQGIEGSASRLLPLDDALLLVGGMHEAGGRHVDAIVRWTGYDFDPIALPAPWSSVHDAIEFEGSLHLAGSFGVDVAERSAILARETPSGWELLDGSTYTLPVQAVCVWQGKLWIGGGTKFAEGEELVALQSYDGERFEALMLDPVPEIRAMAVYNDRLVIAGVIREIDGRPFNMIAAYDGVTWDTLDGGLGGSVDCLIVHDDELIAGGYFNVSAANEPVRSIARWDGDSWRPLGDGFRLDDGPPALDATASVVALGIHDGELVATGKFDRSGDRPLRRLARWDGQAWQALGGGLDPTPGTALGSWRGDLYVAGHFVEAGSTSSFGFARWIATPPDVPDSGIALRSIAPNPLNPSTTIRFALSRRDRVRVDVYDVRGRHVARLLDEVRDAGPHAVVWSGQEDGLRAVASGVYYVRITGADGADHGKMTLVR